MKIKELTISEWQHIQARWAFDNFGIQTSGQQLYGVTEELGELALAILSSLGKLSHAHLKTEQGIRGTAEEHRAAKKDAIGDMVIYLMSYCNLEGFNLQSIIDETCEEVFKRDWKKFPKNGVSE